ncbi:hypothetical protein C8R45DRAFT_948514 [Mycena sanguinolenta]|nr:hypothetical protein C8R45DRAFT_948514 [Mycena sanguinolenta]
MLAYARMQAPRQFANPPIASRASHAPFYGLTATRYTVIYLHPKLKLENITAVLGSNVDAVSSAGGLRTRRMGSGDSTVPNPVKKINPHTLLSHRPRLLHTHRLGLRPSNGASRAVPIEADRTRVKATPRTGAILAAFAVSPNLLSQIFRSSPSMRAAMSRNRAPSLNNRVCAHVPAHNPHPDSRSASHSWSPSSATTSLALRLPPQQVKHCTKPRWLGKPRHLVSNSRCTRAARRRRPIAERRLGGIQLQAVTRAGGSWGAIPSPKAAQVSDERAGHAQRCPRCARATQRRSHPSPPRRHTSACVSELHSEMTALYHTARQTSLARRRVTARRVIRSRKDYRPRLCWTQSAAGAWHHTTLISKSPPRRWVGLVVERKRSGWAPVLHSARMALGHRRSRLARAGSLPPTHASERQWRKRTVQEPSERARSRSVRVSRQSPAYAYQPTAAPCANTRRDLYACGSGQQHRPDWRRAAHGFQRGSCWRYTISKESNSNRMVLDHLPRSESKRVNGIKLWEELLLGSREGNLGKHVGDASET